MAIYSFNTILLSAQKTGNPQLIGTSLSASGVNTISLSTNDSGIAFNSKTPLLSSTTTFNVAGSVFVIDRAYEGEKLALVKINGTYTTFTLATAYSTTPLSSFSTDDMVSTPDTRRKRLLGY